jgi:integrase
MEDRLMKKADKKHITTGKSGYLFYQRRYKGERYYFSLKTKDWNEAMILRDQYNYEINKYGQIIFQEEETESIVPIFGQLCQEWFNDKKVDPSVREDTLSNYKTVLNGQIVKTLFVNKPIDKIMRFEIEDWWKQHLSKTCSAITINYYLDVLSNVFEYAIGRYIPHNPVKGISRPKNDPDEINPFEPDEVRKLLQAAKEHEKIFSKYIESVHDYILVKIFTGLRISEINALETRKHIDLKKRVIKVRQSIVDGVIGKPKTNSSKRNVDVSKTVRNAVRRQRKRSLRKGSKFLFFNSFGNPICSRNFSRNVWKPLVKLTGLEHRTFEQTRHTFASLFLAKGERPYYISKQMGHKNLHITLSVYAKFIPNDNDGQIIEKVTEQLQSCGEDEKSDSDTRLKL